MRTHDVPHDISEKETAADFENDVSRDQLLHLPIGDSRGGWLLGQGFSRCSSRFKIHKPSQLDLAFHIGFAS